MKKRMIEDSVTNEIIGTKSSKEERGNLSLLLSRATPFPNETGALAIGEFTPTASCSMNHKVLVLGAGGLGCEILKNLAMSNCIITEVHVIDLDTIDVTNLNRQFLFRSKDIGHSKAEVSAKFIMDRCPWMKVLPYFKKIQDLPVEFFSQFSCIVSGLDNIEARRYVNSLICGLVEIDEDGDPLDPSSIIPFVDGGTEGFKGQARVILPLITSCFECSLDSFPPKQTYPLCTVAETPRLPEHCITWAFILEWPRIFPSQKFNADSPQDVSWVYETALKRAKNYGISDVTYMLTLGVVKNIIPAVASTNAIIAASCVNEVIKLLTFSSQTLNTYMMYMGTAGIYSHTFVYEKKNDCPVCSSVTKTLIVNKNTTSLNTFLQSLCAGQLRLIKPSAVSSQGKTLYMPNPPALERATRPNLDRLLKDLIEDGDDIVITDDVLAHSSLTISIQFEE